MLASAALLLILGRHLTFWADELDWLTFADHYSLRELLYPHAGHLIAIPRAIYETLPRVFDSSYVPFRVLAVICFQAVAVCVFVLVRRRVGTLLALAPAIVLLFFGSAQDMTISPLGIPFTLSIALGLGALVAVERGSGAGDLLAMVLIGASILTHTFGTIIAVGIAVYLALEPGARRRLWLVAIPLAGWIAWWLWARQFDQSLASITNAPAVPLFLVKAAGATLQGLVGIPPDLGGRAPALADAIRVGFDAVAIALLAALVWWLRSGRGRPSPWLWAYAVMGIAFWVGIGLSEVDRSPSTPRYLFFSGIIVVLIAAEALRGRRLAAPALRAVGAGFAVCLAGNTALLVSEYPSFNSDAADVRAQIGALTLDRAAVDLDVRVRELGSPASAYIPSSAAQLLAFQDRYGPLGSSLSELEAQPEEVRAGADFVAARATGLRAVPVARRDLPGDLACTRPRPAGSGRIPLRPGLNLLDYAAGTAPGPLLAGRYAGAATVPIGVTGGGTTAVFVPQVGGLPWYAYVAAGGERSWCGTGS